MKIFVVLFTLVAGLCAAIGQPRVAWKTSQVVGSPEPPKAFVQQQVFPQLQFSEPVELVVVPGRDRWLVLERKGKILTFPTTGAAGSADEVGDLLALHPGLGNAFSLVLHPKFRENRQLFVCYTDGGASEDGTKVSRFTFASLDPLRVDPGSEEVIITWLSGGHNGANLQFGPEGYLYISTGDGGTASPADGLNTGQDTSDLLSSILRIDVDRRDPGKKYRVPPDNPWFNGHAAPESGSTGSKSPGTRPEIWAFGLRNPWRMNFDPATGYLWCGDVGWELWEMVYLIKRGGNYGWSAYEASQPVKVHLASPLAPISPPIVAHPHTESASITGGYVYHGRQFPELANAYIYGDWETGKIWALWYDGQRVTRHEEIADTPHRIVTFGQDDDGELFYLHYATPGTIHRLARNPQAAPRAPFPGKLSATGLFADVARQKPAAGVHGFSITSPMWEDGTSASRLIGLPGHSQITTSVKIDRDSRSSQVKAEYSVHWPRNAVLARTIVLGKLAPTESERSRPIETQLLYYDGDDWNAYSYRWNSAGTDADLVPAEGAEMTIGASVDPHALEQGSRQYTWRFYGRAECLRCHQQRRGAPLAFNATQLRGVSGPQTNELIERGLVDSDFFEQTRIEADLRSGGNHAARTVLHVNCAPCHRPHAGGSVPVFFNLEFLTAQTNAVGVPPTQGGFGLPDPKIIDPGDPWNSVLCVRMAKSGGGHMPLIGARDVDVEGLRTVEDWIARMSSDRAAPKPWTEVNWDRTMIERELATVGGAMRLRRAIDDGKINASLRAIAYQIAWVSPEPTVRDIFERFKPDARRERTLGVRIDPAEVLGLKGDASRGAALVSAGGKLVGCQACHLIQGQGRHFGPDLVGIGARLSREQILESIVAPSRSVAAQYRATLVELRDGTAHLGFVISRNDRAISLTIPTGRTIEIKLGEIAAEKSSPASLMPEGLLQGLAPQEAVDLVAYLVSLK